MLLGLVLSTQMALALAMFFAGLRLSRRSGPVVSVVAALAFILMVAFPMMRVFSTHTLALLGPALTSVTEFTGMAVPAGLLFGIATPRLPRKSDRTAVYALLLIAGAFFIRSGWWMVGPGVTNLGAPKWNGDICLQSDDSTCVAASMATLLRSRGVNAAEAEMAKLSYVEPGSGTTDSRAVWALNRKLASTNRTDLRVRYDHMSFTDLVAAQKPCMVALNWGFFTSHMVCVMSADSATVTIGDPLSGRRELSADEFRSQWKGRTVRLD